MGKLLGRFLDVLSVLFMLAIPLLIGFAIWAGVDDIQREAEIVCEPGYVKMRGRGSAPSVCVQGYKP